MKLQYRLSVLLLAVVLLASILGACGNANTEAVSAASESSDIDTTASAAEPQVQEEPAPNAADSADQMESIQEASAAEEVVPAPEVETLGSIVRTSYAETALPLTEDDVTFTAWDYVVPPVGAVISNLGTEATLYIQLQERTGIHFDFTTANLLTASDSIALMVAANELPDIIFDFTKFYSGSLDQLVEDEMIIDFAEYEDLMPNYFDIINNNPSVFRDVYTDGGYVPTANSIRMELYPSSGPVIRQDWLTQLGLAQPVTFDDMTNVLQEIKSAGLSTYPMWCPSNLSYSANGVASGFDVATDADTDGIGGWTYRDGKVTFSITDPGYEEYVALLANWYAQGLISPDFFSATASGTASANAITGGGAAIWWTSTMSMTTLSAYEECDVQAIAAPVKAAGDLMYYDDAGASYVGVGSAVAASCPDVNLAVQMMDYLYSEEGILLANFGIEGETFEYDEENTPQLTELVTNNPDGLAFSIAVIKYTSSSDFCSVLDPARNTLAYTDAQKASIDLWKRTGDSHLAPGADWTQEAQTEYYNTMSDITSYCGTVIMQFVVGDRSIAEWDTFLTELDSAFGSDITRCTELYQEAINRYLEKAA